MRLSVLSLSLRFLAVIVFFSACKPQAQPQAADLQSLDNLARADGEGLSYNSCGDPNGTPVARIKVSGGSRESAQAVQAALTAVPKPILEAFAAVSGEVVLNQNPSALCPQAMNRAEREFANENSSGSPELAPCWVLEQRVIRVVLPDDPKLIRHQTVRIMSYVYTQFFAKRLADLAANGAGTINSETASTIRATVERLRMQQEDLGAKFLTDLSTRTDRSAFNRLVKLKSSDEESFSNFVLAEAIDSAYCSEATARKFHSMFPEAWNSFSRGDNRWGSARSDLGPAFHKFN